MVQRPLSRISVLSLLCTLLVSAQSAQAQITRIGDTKVAYPKSPSARFPDVAYDNLHDVYLVVSGQQPIEGRFVDNAGNPIGTAFRVSPSTGVIASRVAFNSTTNTFVVTWLDENSPVSTDDVITVRLLRYNGSGPEFLTGEIFLGKNGVAKHTESAPSLACSTVSGECLVSWAQWANPWDIQGQRIDSTNGAILGPEIPIATGVNWDGLPSMAYNSQQNEYFVVHMSETPGGIQYIVGERIQGGTGAHLGRNTLYGKAGLNNYPEVAYNSRGNLYMVVSWYFNPAPTGADVYGILADGNGSPITPVIPVSANPFFEGGDGIGIAYNPVQDGYFAVFQGPSSDTLGVEISGLGAPSPVFRAMVSGAAKDIYQPQIAGSTTANRYLIGTSVDYNRVSVQLLGGPDGPNPNPNPNPTPTPTLIDLSQEGTPNGSWFLAEGAAGSTGFGFNSYYLVANENAVPVTVRAYFAREDGQAVAKNYTIAAFSRLTIDLRAEVGNGAYGTVFQSLTPGAEIYVERSVYWGTNFEGSTAEVGTKILNHVWYFAEGSCGCDFWNNFFLVFNPTQTPVTLNVVYSLDNGTTATRDYVVGAQSRLTIVANNVGELSGHNFGTTITASGPVVAERAMYWGPQWLGGTVSMGAMAAGKYWSFAEGNATPGFDTFYLLLNPTDTPTTVTATFAVGAGGTQQRVFSLGPHTRMNVWLNEQLGQVGAAAAQFVSDAASIIVERSIYWSWQGSAGWIEGTNTIGAQFLAANWHVPEGTTVDRFDDFLLVYNPNAFDVDLNVSIFTDAGTHGTLAIHVPASSRQSYYMKSLLEQLAADGVTPSASFATRVSVVGGASGVIVEHAQYWNREDPNYWHAGAASFGIPR